MVNEAAHARGLRRPKRFGQVFLVNRNIARKEASLAAGKRVLELGTGSGMLTEELARTAKSVVTVEIDGRVFEAARERIREYKNVRMIEGDFFKINVREYGDFDMFVSNVPYSLSSDTIYWIMQIKVPSVLCLQREFVLHMLAGPGTRKYSRISVMSRLVLEVQRIMDVQRTAFRPVPNVDSELIAVNAIGRELDGKALRILSILMEHKKKLVRNAVVDSSAALGIDKDSARRISDSLDLEGDRLFRLAPSKIYQISEEIAAALRSEDLGRI